MGSRSSFIVFTLIALSLGGPIAAAATVARELTSCLTDIWEERFDPMGPMQTTPTHFSRTIPPAPPLAAWRPDAASPPEIRPENLFPREFLLELESQAGVWPVLSVHHARSALGLRDQLLMSLGAKTQTLFHVSIRRSQGGRVWQVEDFLLQKFAPPTGIAGFRGASDSLRATQNKPGLRGDVVKGLRDRLLVWARASGAEKLRTYGGSSYTVDQLYRRILGFKPAPGSTTTLAYLDRAYRFASRELEPAALRPKSTDDFVRRYLGTAAEYHLTLEDMSAFIQWRATGRIEDPIRQTALHWPDGRLFGLAFQDTKGGPTRIALVDQPTDSEAPMTWISLLTEHRIVLERSLKER